LDTVQDFEDILALFDHFAVHYRSSGRSPSPITSSRATPQVPTSRSTPFQRTSSESTEPWQGPLVPSSSTPKIPKRSYRSASNQTASTCFANLVAMRLMGLAPGELRPGAVTLRRTGSTSTVSLPTSAVSTTQCVGMAPKFLLASQSSSVSLETAGEMFPRRGDTT